MLTRSQDAEWLLPIDAAALLGVNPWTLRNNYAVWGIRCLRLPHPNGRGMRRFNREDVLRVRAEMEAKAEASVARPPGAVLPQPSGPQRAAR